MDYTKAVLIVQIGREEEDKYELEYFSKCSDKGRFEIIQVLMSLPFIVFVDKKTFIMPKIHIKNVTDCLKSNSICYIISDETVEAIYCEDESDEVNESDTEEAQYSKPRQVTANSLSVKISQSSV